MFGMLQRLVSSVPSVPKKRPVLTPGRLYAKMSEEFRGHREKVGCSCIMPLPSTREPPADGGCNWEIRPLWSHCTRCDDFLKDLVARYQATYDVFDPTHEYTVASLGVDEETLARLG